MKNRCPRPSCVKGVGLEFVQLPISDAKRLSWLRSITPLQVRTVKANVPKVRAIRVIHHLVAAWRPFNGLLGGSAGRRSFLVTSGVRARLAVPTRDLPAENEGAAPRAQERHLLLALFSAGHRASEFWETLGYVAIWLCGLAGIGVCFL